MSAVDRCPDCGTPIPRLSPGGMCPKCLLEQGVGADALPETGPAFAPQSPGEGPMGLDPALVAALPQFEFLEVLGQGGMGTVYKVRHIPLDRIVALKVMLRRDPEFVERFSREVRLLARLNHPHVVAVHDFGQVGDRCYFVMEYVDGSSLRSLLRAGPLSPRQALEIVPQICAALQYAHNAGIVHRDIKPENLLIDRNGQVKVADFGLARLVDEEPAAVRLTGTRQVMGTVGYMAPEQLEGARGVDHRADIYSLGVVLYELLTGELPLGRFEPPSRMAPVDSRLDPVVLRSLDRQPDRRYQRASDVALDVEAIRSNPMATFREPEPVTSDPNCDCGVWERTSNWIRSEFQPSTLMIVGALAVGGLVLLSFGIGLTALLIPLHRSSDVAQPTIQGDFGQGALSPLWNAVERGDLADVTRLLSQRADPNERTSGGTTVLGLAAARGNASIVQALVFAGAVVDDRDAKGTTPLMLAAFRGHVGAVTELLKSGADLKARSDEGLTALDEAVAGGRRSMVDLLESRGASKTANQVLWEAWQQARSGRPELALQLLTEHMELVEDSTTPVRFRIEDWQYDAASARLLLRLMRLECQQRLGDAAGVQESAREVRQRQQVTGSPPRVEVFARRKLSPRAQKTFATDPDNFVQEVFHISGNLMSELEQNPQAVLLVQAAYSRRENTGHLVHEETGARGEQGIIH